MRFDFTLVPLDEIQPWGPSEQPRLHWFGLTDGQYWLNVGADTLFEYSDAAREAGASRYCSYQVARLHEDLIEALPYILDPVPADLIPNLTGDGRTQTKARASQWSDRRTESISSDDDDGDVADLAVAWIGQRELSTAHLSPSPDFVMWSDGDAVHIEWDHRAKLTDGVPAWSATHGSYSVPRVQFIEQVRSFHERLMQAMDERIQTIAAGALRPDIEIDVPGLLREHRLRASLPEVNFGPPSQPMDWDEVRRALRVIHAGPNSP